MAELLIKHGADLSAQDKEGQFTPLHLAAQRDQRQVAELLLKLGANVNATTDKLATSLHWASAFKLTEMAELLIDHGANVNAVNSSRYTPLCLAVNKENLRLTKKMIQAGADVNCDGILGCSPLYFACCKGSAEMVQALIDAGADVNAIGCDDKTPLQVALRYDHMHLARLLFANGANLPEESSDDESEEDVQSDLALENEQGLVDSVGFLSIEHTESSPDCLKESDNEEFSAATTSGSTLDSKEVLPECPVCFGQCRGRNVIFHPCRCDKVCQKCTDWLQGLKTAYCPICGEEIVVFQIWKKEYQKKYQRKRNKKKGRLLLENEQPAI